MPIVSCDQRPSYCDQMWRWSDYPAVSIHLQAASVLSSSTTQLRNKMITDNLKDAFQSERLVYRAAENNKDDKDFLLTEIVNDAINTALSDIALIRPRGEK